MFGTLLAVGVYTLLAVLVTFPLILHLNDRFAGFPYGDAYENARHMWWMGRALQAGTSPFEQPLLGYPDGMAGLTLQATPLLLFPGWLFALALPLPAAYNLQVLLTLVLNGLAMYGFARALTRREDAALVAGAAFMTLPLLQGHLGASHLNILAQWGLPLYAWGLWYLSGPERRGSAWVAAGTALAFVAVAWAHTIQVVYALLPVTGWFALAALSRRDGRALLRIVTAAGAGTALLFLWLLPVIGTAFSSAYAQEGGSVRYSADLLAAVTPSFFHPLWGQLAHTRAVLGTNLDEGAGYLGLAAGGLALLGLWRVRDARGWALLALAAYVLALGPLLKINDTPVTFVSDGYPSSIALPWALFERLPGLSLARTPARFLITVGFVVSVMVGYGAAWLLARTRARWRLALVALCIALITADNQTFFPLPTTRADLPPALAALSERDDVRAVFDIPWDNLEAAKQALYAQTAHGLPLVAGQVTRRTPVDPAKLTLLQTTLDPALLAAAGADIILVHRAFADDDLEARVAALLGQPLYEDDRFAVFARPAAAAPQFTSLELPFTETGPLTYVFAPQASWSSFDLRLRGEGQQVTVRLNGERVWSGRADDTITLRLTLPFPAGYSTLDAVTDPACPARPPLGLRCARLTAEALLFASRQPMETTEATFADGIRLTAGGLQADDDAADIWLAWSFAQGLDALQVRYVHVLDAAGVLVAQSDGPPGPLTPGGWVESIPIGLSTLAAGEYRVVVGWYRLPSVAAIPRIDAQAATVEIGRFVLP